VTDLTPHAVQSCHELLLWLLPLLDRLPRVRRFTLGERIESALLEMLEALVEATYSAGGAKQTALKRANLKLEVTRHLWRLCHESQLIPTRRYEHGARLMDDLGRQVGGWLRSRAGAAEAAPAGPTALAVSGPPPGQSTQTLPSQM
jgi:hypothetical protein